MVKQVLGLQLPTDPRWVDIVNKNIADILIDHAYCEQKAASSCISLILKFPEKKELVEELMPIVSEEWTHFRMVVQELYKRGFELGKQRKDEYVIALSKLEKKGGSREDQLIEKLLFNALIEARSCERFRLLSKYLTDQNLKVFYYELMVSEAGHYKTFLNLAKKYADNQKVEIRWKQILQMEAEIMKLIEHRPDRIH